MKSFDTRSWHEQFWNVTPEPSSFKPHPLRRVIWRAMVAIFVIDAAAIGALVWLLMRGQG